MNGNQIRNNLNMLNLQISGLRGAGQLGKFGSGAFNALASDWQDPKKKKKGGKKKKQKNKDQKRKDPKDKDQKQDEVPQSAAASRTQKTESQTEKNVVTAGSSSGKKDSLKTMNLQEAFVWTEILGEPMARKSRRRRVNQRYGSQGNVDRG